MIEKLLQLFVREVDAELLETIVLQHAKGKGDYRVIFEHYIQVSLQKKTINSQSKTHVEDLESGDIQYTDEVVPLLLRVQSVVTFLDQELEATIKHGLSQGTHGVRALIFGSTLCHKLVPDFDTRFAQILVQIGGGDAQQVGHSLTLLCAVRLCLFFSWPLLELQFTEVHD